MPTRGGIPLPLSHSVGFPLFWTCQVTRAALKMFIVHTVKPNHFICVSLVEMRQPKAGSFRKQREQKKRKESQT